MSNQYLPPVIAIPSSLLITNITRSCPMVVTVAIGNSSTEADTYIVGMAIKLFVPRSYNMTQANGLVGTITAINGFDLTLNLESTLFDPFIIPTGNVEQPATIAPNGSRNYEYNNYSKLVPFQSLNNIGN